MIFPVSPLVYLTTFGLGLAEIIQRQRKKLFAILGTVLSGLALAGFLLLVTIALLTP